MHPAIRKAMQTNAQKRKEREERRLAQNAKIVQQTRQNEPGRGA